MEIFSDFDYHWPITHIELEKGYTDASGRLQPDKVISNTPLCGHLKDISLKEVLRAPEGMYLPGDRRLHTSASLKIGDLLEIVEPDTSSSTWKVVGLLSGTHTLFTDPIRYAYHLRWQ